MVVNNRQLTFIIWAMVILLFLYRFAGNEAPIYELIQQP